MAFTATLTSITPQDDGTNSATIIFLASVTFSDSATGFIATKTYSFPSNVNQATAVAAITADGNLYKAELATLSNLQTRVGTVLTI